MVRKKTEKETENVSKEERPRGTKNTPDNENQTKDAKKFPLPVKILIVVLLVILVAITAFFISKTILLPKYQQYKVNKEFITPPKKKPEKEKPREMGQIFEIKDLTVNTFGSGGRRFVVAEFAFETKSDEAFKELGVRAPQIRDMIINYLRHYSAEQILALSFQETSRMELTKNINELLQSGEIDSLYFITLVLQ